MELFSLMDWRVPALAGLGVALASAMIVAIHQFRFFAQYRDPEKFVERELRRSRVRAGRRSSDPTRIDARRARIKAVKDAAWRAMWARFVLLVTAGHLVPTAVMFAVVLNYSAFLPGALPLEDAGTGAPLATAAPLSVLAFVADQFFRGAFLDAAEVFRLETSPLTNNTGDWLFASLLIFFRALTGVYTGALLFFLAQALIARIRIGRFLRRRGDDALNAP